jgi:hypothetical protein
MLDTSKLLELYPEYDKLNGPYIRKDGRKHIVLNNSSLPKGSENKLKTISYPKALVEIREGRRLNKDETVDHDDQDFTNDELSNLIIRDRVDHCKLDARRRKEIHGNCIWCGNGLILTRSQLDGRSVGPFCSKKCSGKYGVSVQRGGNQLERIVIRSEYYNLKNLCV